MTLLRLYRLSEAGIPHAPMGGGKKKRPPSGAGSVLFPSVKDDEDEIEPDEEDDDDLGADMDYDDPSPPEQDDVADEPTKDEPEEKSASPFASKPAPPSKALQGGQAGVGVKADKATMKALAQAFEAVRTKDDDLQDWIDDCIREIGRAIKSGADTVTLPKFEATPDLDNFDDDGGSEEDY